MQNKLKFNVLEISKWSSLDQKDYGELKNLKKMQARRMTSLAKKIIDIALGMQSKDEIDFIVYSSRHGELLLSYELIKSIHKKEALSPIKFSQSTHNSTAGLLCILGGFRVPSTAICAGDESFSMGVLNCVNYLTAKPKSKVLYLFADAKLPKVYENKVKGQNEEIIVAMTLSGGSDYSMCVANKNKVSTENESFQFLNWLGANEKELALSSLSFMRENL